MAEAESDHGLVVTAEGRAQLALAKLARAFVALARRSQESHDPATGEAAELEARP